MNQQFSKGKRVLEKSSGERERSRDLDSWQARKRKIDCEVSSFIFD